MRINNTVSRITAYLHRNISGDILEALKTAGVQDLCTWPGRSLVVELKSGLLSLLPGRDLAGDPLDIVLLLVHKNVEDALFNLIVDKGRLNLPGRGSVVIEDVNLLMAHEFCAANEFQAFDVPALPIHPHALTGICCIVQRGQGDLVARIALDMGICVPSLYFGTGTGIRDKMGLLRITIPPEKEIIYVFTTIHEADHIMEMMIDAGKLDQPGKGFIYAFPVRKGLVNMKVTRGGRRHAASIEQIVAALDHIKGGNEWRDRGVSLDKITVGKKKYIMDLVDMTLLCDAGTGADLVKTAMSAGAGGGTLANVRHIRPDDSPLSQLSPAREACSIVIPRDRTEAVASALEQAGAFTERCHGQIHVRQTLRAFTYVWS